MPVDPDLVILLAESIVPSLIVVVVMWAFWELLLPPP